MKSVVAVNPFQCRMWELHDRIEGHITEKTCKAEIESFRRHGQLIPVLGRPLEGDHRHRVELIYGARRLFVARHLNVQLMVELREITDRDAIIAMDIENRVRCDISAYERGVSYARWLREGHFSSQEDIARALRVSPSHVCRLLKLAHLPAVVVSAFDDPGSICEGWGLAIAQVLEDPERRPSVIHAARCIAKTFPRPQAREVYQQLIAPKVSGRRIKAPTHDEVVKDAVGRPMFRIRQQRSSIAFVVPLTGLGPAMLNDLRRAISKVLSVGGGARQPVEAEEPLRRPAQELIAARFAAGSSGDVTLSRHPPDSSRNGRDGDGERAAEA